jgi:hypothetical protein
MIPNSYFILYFFFPTNPNERDVLIATGVSRNDSRTARRNFVSGLKNVG